MVASGSRPMSRYAKARAKACDMSLRVALLMIFSRRMCWQGGCFKRGIGLRQGQQVGALRQVEVRRACTGAGGNGRSPGRSTVAEARPCDRVEGASDHF